MTLQRLLVVMGCCLVGAGCTRETADLGEGVASASQGSSLTTASPSASKGSHGGAAAAATTAHTSALAASPLAVVAANEVSYDPTGSGLPPDATDVQRAIDDLAARPSQGPQGPIGPQGPQG